MIYFPNVKNNAFRFEYKYRFFCPFSGHRRTSRRRGPDGQEMRNLKQPSINCLEVPPMSVNHGGHWSDDESELPPTKRARDNGYASDHTAITDYEDMWGQQHMDSRPVILTPPSMVCFIHTFFKFGFCDEQRI